MRNLFKNISISNNRPVVSTFLHVYQSEGPKRADRIFCIEYKTASFPVFDYKTALFVVFDGETQHRFSSVRIVLYCDTVWMNAKPSWGIRQLESITHGSRGHVHNASPNDPTLPQLTVVFEITPHLFSRDYYELVPQSSGDEMRSRDTKSVCVLLECEHSITTGTLFLSVAFEHSNMLRTTSNPPESFCGHNANSLDHVTTHTVRVIPIDGARSRTTIRCLPTELLMKIFEATDSCDWQHDLLSFAQVCRRWSCAMTVLFARLESSEWKNHCVFLPSQYLDPSVLAEALSETPALGSELQRLDLDQHNGSWECWNHAIQKISPGFNAALITILRATKNLQRLHLSQGYSSKANALFSALPELHHLHSLSITRTRCQFSPVPSREYWDHSVSTAQLACCMGRCPALTSLTVEGLIPGTLGMRQFFLRRPVCALTQLCIRKSQVSDKDLLYLTASSANTLTQVTLDGVSGITHDGLHIFLDSISQNVTSLAILDVEFSPGRKEGPTEYALDVVVDKMRCLQALRIRGDVASEYMLRRRSEMLMRGCGEGEDGGVPVIRLSSRGVPGIGGYTGDEWPGWQAVEFF